MDEPTTGLDSFMAEQILRHLKSHARGAYGVQAQGTSYGANLATVVCTIHQPSIEVFNLLDTLCLLVDGCIAYFGPAAEVAAYFGSLG